MEEIGNEIGSVREEQKPQETEENPKRNARLEATDQTEDEWRGGETKIPNQKDIVEAACPQCAKENEKTAPSTGDAEQHNGLEMIPENHFGSRRNHTFVKDLIEH